MTDDIWIKRIRKLIENARSAIGVNSDETAELADATEHAFDVIQALRGLHRGPASHAGSGPLHCVTCSEPMPCRTIQVIDDPGAVA